jgi:hypothetical protein
MIIWSRREDCNLRPAHYEYWLKDAKIGESQTIQPFFSYFNTDANNIRNNADIGGGLMDSSRSPQLPETSADA